VAVVFVATLIRSTIGFGEALVAVPLLALRIPIAVAAPLAVAISVLVAAMIVAHDWREIHVRSAAGLLVAAMIGIPFGLLLLTHVDDRVTRRILAAVIIAFSVYSLLVKQRVHLQRDHPVWLALAGFFSGVLGGAYGMNGPPLAVYGSLRRWSPQHFRATLQGYFLPASLVGLIGYFALGIWGREVTRYLLVCLPAAILATFAGRSLNRRLSGEKFFRYVYVGLIATGIVLIVR
jgi:uncharacterized membrane protein YfcA